MLNRLERIHQEITQEQLDLIEFARKLRQDATDAESLLWGCLRARRMNKRKFRRQHPIKPYVLDFYCAELQLAVELDGGQHNEAAGLEHDAAREQFLRERGIRTMRFTNRAMLMETDSVLDVIWKATRAGDENDPSP